MGIVLVALLAGSTIVEDGAKMTSTFMRTNSAASAGSWLTLSAQRNSMRMFLPSTQPRSRKPARSTSTRLSRAEAGPRSRYPMRATFAGCCARAVSGHATAEPTNEMKSRRLMCPQIEGPNLPYRRGSRNRVVRHSKIGRPTSGLGQKPALPCRSIDVRFALNKQTLTERVQCDAIS
jgi:hypothetical protein